MQNQRTCVIYARKSTDREDMQILSIEGQLRELREYAARASLKVSAELVESCSAREPGRPIFSKLLADAQAGRVERILSWKLDRLARNPVDGGALIYALGKGRFQELVTPEGTYTGTGDSKFMLAVLFGTATKMTDDLSAGVKRGCRDVCEKGRIPGLPPVGYMKIRDRSGFRGAGKVVPDPERFPLVQRLWLDVASGTVTASEAWRRAVAAGLTTRGVGSRLAAPIRFSHVFSVLKNRFYAGLISHGGNLYRGEHEPMITVEQFEQVQKQLGRNDAPRPSRHAFLFRGLLRCGDCGGVRAMVGEQHITTAKNRFVYYRCGRRRPGYSRCQSRPITEKTIFDAASASLQQITISPNVARWTMEAIDWWIEQQHGVTTTSLVAIERQIRDCKEKLQRITDLVITGTLTEEEYRKRKEVLQVELTQLQVRAESPTTEQQLWRDTISEIVDLAVKGAATFKSANSEQRRAILAQLYANVEIQSGIPRFSLVRPYSLLSDAPTVHAGVPDSYANFPHPSECWSHSKKAARRSKLVAAFSLWCTPDDSNV